MVPVEIAMPRRLSLTMSIMTPLVICKTGWNRGIDQSRKTCVSLEDPA